MIPYFIVFKVWEFCKNAFIYSYTDCEIFFPIDYMLFLLSFDKYGHMLCSCSKPTPEEKLN